jgi:hypothetical protein
MYIGVSRPTPDQICSSLTPASLAGRSLARHVVLAGRLSSPNGATVGGGAVVGRSAVEPERRVGRWFVAVVAARRGGGERAEHRRGPEEGSHGADHTAAARRDARGFPPDARKPATASSLAQGHFQPRCESPLQSVMRVSEAARDRLIVRSEAAGAEYFRTAHLLPEWLAHLLM